MNDEREELADIIQDAGEYIPGSHGEDYVNPRKAADAILAAGYAKPRTITTVEELDALPGESMVRDASGTPYELDYTIGNPSDKWWITTGMTGRLECRHIALPATVLYEPLP